MFRLAEEQQNNPEISVNALSLNLSSLPEKNQVTLRNRENFQIEQNLLVSRLTEFSKNCRQNHETEKLAIEGKIESVLSEVRRLAREIELVKIKNESFVGLSPNKNDEQTQNQNSCSSTSKSESESTLNQLNQLWTRLETVEQQMALSTEQNAKLERRLAECAQQITRDEQTRAELDQKLDTMANINQLMQLKLLAIETKVANSSLANSTAVSPLQETSPTSFPPPYAAATGQLYPNLPKLVMVNNPSGDTYGHYQNQHPLSSPPVGFPGPQSYPLQPGTNTDNYKTVETTSTDHSGQSFTEGFNSLKSKLTALVSPIKPLLTTAIDRQFSYNGNSTTSPEFYAHQRPLQLRLHQSHQHHGHSQTSPTSPTSPTAPSMGAPSSETSDETLGSHHRRHHRRHHRIKLFPSSSNSRRRQH